MTSQKAKFNALNLNDLRACLTWLRANLSRKDRKGIMFSVIICSILSITDPQLYDFTSVSGAKKAHVPPSPLTSRGSRTQSHDNGNLFALLGLAQTDGQTDLSRSRVSMGSAAPG